MVLEVKGLCKEYMRGSQPFYAVDHVDFTLNKGEFVSIIGRSGSGKSTMLNLIAGLLEPTEGTVTIAGKCLTGMSDEELSVVRNTVLGYVPQGQTVLSNLSVLDNVRLPFYFSQREGTSTERALELMKMVGIDHLAESMPKELSGGELRRVSIARALMCSHDLLVLDEPTGDLDPETTAEIMDLLQKIAAEGTAVLMVTHELDTTSYGHKTYVMDRGHLSQK
ncbi:MAG: ABC transporter ATP-binding protein [Clostridia bacterium]|nr:ABC transporter ATP-binding protein [Clostridia bacterium]